MAIESTDQLMAEISDHWYKEADGNLYKIVDVLNGPMERISDNAHTVELWRVIDNAQGTTLDLFGKDIKTPRPTSDDEAYRFLIRLKYLLARAQGTIPSIVKIVGTAMGTKQGIKIWRTDIPRHVGILLPLDKLQDKYIEKFILDNLQHMLALGYWLQTVVFYEQFTGSLHVGAFTLEQSKTKTVAVRKQIEQESKQMVVGAMTFSHRHYLTQARSWENGFFAWLGTIGAVTLEHGHFVFKIRKDEQDMFDLTQRTMPINQAEANEDIYDDKFKVSPQIRLYNGTNNSAGSCKNDPFGSGVWFMALYFISNRGGNLIVIDTYNNVWSKACNLGVYDNDWTKFATKADISNLQNQINDLKGKIK